MNNRADDEYQDNGDAHGAAAHNDAHGHPNCRHACTDGARRGCVHACGTTVRARDRAHAFPLNATRCPLPSLVALMLTGFRLVAADASTVRFGLRASHVKRAAVADQLVFGLFLPGAELMLSASLYSTDVGERQMLVEQLDRLGKDDLLLLDRGYPCYWMPAVLNQRRIAFCMRVEQARGGGFPCVNQFLKSGLQEQIVMLRAPDRRDALDYECPIEPQTVRLIRHVASTGKVRVLMTNLLDVEQFPAALFGDLYHQRWRIEEAFKRLKHRLHLEHVTGLSQQALMQDLAAKVLCDNLQALASCAAGQQDALPTDRRINRAYVHSVLKPLLPSLLLGLAAAHLLADALALIAKRTFLHRPGQSRSRQTNAYKPHKYMAYKAA